MEKTLPRALDASTDAGLGLGLWVLGFHVRFAVSGFSQGVGKVCRPGLAYRWCEALKLVSYGLGDNDWNMSGPTRA